MRLLMACVVVSGSLFASDVAVKRAAELYHRTDYQGSLQILARDPSPDAATMHLSGKDYFMLGDYKKATEFFDKAVTTEPSNSNYMLWLGRAYGRRAETGGWFMAGPNASRARQCFEKAVALDPHNGEAMNDLFDYYLNAPGFLGGGIEKAEAIARRIAHERPAEAHFEQAQVASKKKDYHAAEAQLRSAMEMEPRDIGRILDVARFLAAHGRIEESDALFARAEEIGPNDPRVEFARAKFYIDGRRNLDQARRLLQKYLQSDLTPDDPPKQNAEKLLRQASSTTGG
jgi:tetratricopeptide (TPR) repeat protein